MDATPITSGTRTVGNRTVEPPPIDGPLRRRARAVVHLVRPPFALLIIMFTNLGAEQAGGRLRFYGWALLITSIAGWILAVVAMNELGDEDVDRHNLGRQDRRPLINGDLSRHETQLIAAVGSTAALVTAAAISTTVFAVMAIGLGLGAAYSLPPLRLARRGPATSLLLPLGYVAVPFLAGAHTAVAAAASTTPPVGGRPGAVSWLLLTGSYVSFLGRLLLKDFRDLEGDMLYGKRTFLVRFGRLTTVAVSSVMWVVGGVPIVVAAGSVELAVCYGVSALVALWLLERLASSVDELTDDVVIASIAALGRGVLLATICLYGVRNTDVPAWLSSILVAGCTSIGLFAQWRHMGFLTTARRHRLRGSRRRDHVRNGSVHRRDPRGADPDSPAPTTVHVATPPVAVRLDLRRWSSR